jgi:hypothetical protein
MTCVEPLTSIDPYLHILNRAEKPFIYEDAAAVKVKMAAFSVDVSVHRASLGYTSPEPGGG